jgi:hypothetical protein
MSRIVAHQAWQIRQVLNRDPDHLRMQEGRASSGSAGSSTLRSRITNPAHTLEVLDAH